MFNFVASGTPKDVVTQLNRTSVEGDNLGQVVRSFLAELMTDPPGIADDHHEYRYTVKASGADNPDHLTLTLSVEAHFVPRTD